MRRLTAVAAFFICIQGFSHEAANTTGTQQTLTSAACDPAIEMQQEERTSLLSQLEKTVVGKRTLDEFLEKYGSYDKLILQWDLVSYSQIIKPRVLNRTVASVQIAGKAVCVHLTKKLPNIEHLADLVHELNHANRLDTNTLAHTAKTAEEFVEARIAGRGGEAESFAIECTLKRELKSEWDHLCAPYAADDQNMDTPRIAKALYDGDLAASLTGETYPIMLTKQFHRIAKLRASGVK